MNTKLVVCALGALFGLSACNGDETTWVIQRASGAGAPVIMKSGAVNEFTLRPAKKGGKVIYHDVTFAPGAMPDNWNGLTLFPRGSTPYSWPAAKQLDKWDPTLTGTAMATQKSTYATTIANVLATNLVTTDTQRLEGDVHVGGKAEALTLLVVDNAIKQGGKLLIVDLDDTAPGPIQDGSGSGDPR